MMWGFVGDICEVVLGLMSSGRSAACALQHTAFALQHTEFALQHTAFALQRTAFVLQHNNTRAGLPHLHCVAVRCSVF